MTLHLRGSRAGWMAGAVAAVLLALTACTSSSGSTAATSASTDTVGKGARNFQMRQVLAETSTAKVPCPRQIDVAPDPEQPTVACSIDQKTRYRLGPAFVTGLDVVSTSAALPPNGTAWVVSIEFTPDGRAALKNATGRVYQLAAPRNQIAMMVDGFVVSAPAPNGPIDGGAELSGGFDEQQAKLVANRIVPMP